MTASCAHAAGLAIAAAAVLCSGDTPRAQVDARTEGLPAELTVRFEGGLATANYAKVMATLGEANLLELRVYVDPRGNTPAEILANLGYLPGSTVPPALDRFLCRRNPHVCHVDMKHGVPTWKNTGVSRDDPMFNEWKLRHGTLCPTLDKDALPGFTLCMPDADTAAYLSFTEVKYRARDEKLAEIVTERTEGCDRFDDACRKLIVQFNPGIDPFSPSFGGTLMVPVKAYRVTLPVHSSDHLRRLRLALDHTIEQLTRTGQQTAAAPRVYYTVPYAGKQQSEPVRLPADPDSADSRDELKLMRYPYNTDDDFRNATLSRVVVGIWDSAVDENHCDYRDDPPSTALLAVNTIPYRSDVDPNIPTKATNCGVGRTPLTNRWDHGTFTAGIIGARINGRGVVGAHPSAQMWVYEMGKDRLRDDPIPLFARKFGKPDVINLSLTDDQAHALPTDLDAIIRRYKGSILFVAAAGNAFDRENKPVQDPLPFNAGEPCLIFPACWSQQGSGAANVISVVALNAQGQRLQGTHPSNYGTAFDVAALGVAKSTLYGDWIGSMDGTSVAAPFVTALAALIKSKALNVSLQPIQVKQRILATADFSPEVDTLVLFGSINYTRALDLETDVIEPQSQFAPSPFNRRRAIRKTSSERLAITDGIINDVAMKLDPLKVSSIRRIQFDKTSGTFWVAFLDDDGVLKKARNVKFAPGASLKYADAAAPREFDASHVLDYTCALECK